jgi:hypothetical protein
MQPRPIAEVWRLPSCRVCIDLRVPDPAAT